LLVIVSKKQAAWSNRIFLSQDAGVSAMSEFSEGTRLDAARPVGG